MRFYGIYVCKFAVKNAIWPYHSEVKKHESATRLSGKKNHGTDRN